jgi:hypothetical protein
MFILNEIINNNSLNILKNMFETINPNVFVGLFSWLATGLSIVFFIILIGTMILALLVYIYYALTWSTIAKKLNYDKSWIAWIPFANFFLKPILSDYDWKYGFIIIAPFVFIFIPFIGIFISFLAILGIIVFDIICCWTIFKKRGYSSELALVKIGFVIPFLIFLTLIADMIILGIIAWSDPSPKINIKIKKPKKIIKNIKSKSLKK